MIMRIFPVTLLPGCAHWSGSFKDGHDDVLGHDEDGQGHDDGQGHNEDGGGNQGL